MAVGFPTHDGSWIRKVKGKMPSTEAAIFFQFMFGCHSNGTFAKDSIATVLLPLIHPFSVSLLAAIFWEAALTRTPSGPRQNMSRCPSRSTQGFGSCQTLQDGIEFVNRAGQPDSKELSEEDLLNQLQDWVFVCGASIASSVSNTTLPIDKNMVTPSFLRSWMPRSR